MPNYSPKEKELEGSPGPRLGEVSWGKGRVTGATRETGPHATDTLHPGLQTGCLGKDRDVQLEEKPFLLS